ncbi:hypothetical protein JCM5353_003327 [Sporobolomyces roseus]
MSSYFSSECPAENTAAAEESDFFDGRWDQHEIGWVIAGVTAAVSLFLSLLSIIKHCRNYYVPKQQRQIIRILWMPAVYGVVSFFSYRFFRSYTYYSVAVVAYEALVLAAFLMLLLQFIGDSSQEQKEILKNKEKRKIPIPFCCIRFRPSKPYFLHALKWSVLQYSLLRPLISIIEIVCQAYDVLCPTQYSVYFAEVYLDAADFVSISVALYGLIVFYALVKEQLAGKKPLAKFLCIKFVVMILFYQSFVFSVLQSHDVIKATDYWTATNVADGLSALCTCCEMVIFSLWFMWAFNWREYSKLRESHGGGTSTSVFWALLDSFNYWDMLREGYLGIAFLFAYILNKPGTRSGSKKGNKQLRRGEEERWKENEAEGDQGGNELGLDFEAAFVGVANPEGAVSSDEETGSSRRRESWKGVRRKRSSMKGYEGIGEKRDQGRAEGDAGNWNFAEQRSQLHHSDVATAAFPPSSSLVSLQQYPPQPRSREATTSIQEDWRPYTPPNANLR